MLFMIQPLQHAPGTWLSSSYNDPRLFYINSGILMFLFVQSCERQPQHFCVKKVFPFSSNYYAMIAKLRLLHVCIQNIVRLMEEVPIKMVLFCYLGFIKQVTAQSEALHIGMQLWLRI